ncbi:MAG: cyclase family protein [Desulfatiglandales bacterium]
MSNGYEIAKLLKSLNVYDISPVFETNMPEFRTDPPLGIVPDAKNIEQDYYFTQILVISEHNGSHVDAPIHIHKGMDSIDKFPCGYLIGPYKKYDLTGFNPEAGKDITLEQIKEVEARDNILPQAGDIILLQFGWDKYYLPDSKVLFEKDWYAANVPGITEEVMKYFTDVKIRAIGSDAASTDAAYTESKITRMPGREKYFLPNNILPMSGFVHMGKAPAAGLFMAIPLKIKNGSGSPIRPILMDTKNSDEIVRLLGTLKPYDISPVFETNMPGFIYHPTLGIVKDARTYEKYGHYMQTLVICEHNGSHTDSPKHIHKQLASMDQIPCDFLIGPYKKYDFTKHNPQRSTNITLEQVKEVEARDNIKSEAGDIILLQFGWDKYYKPESNDIEDTMMYSFGPGITEEAVKYFAQAKIQAIGADVVSADTCFPDMPGHLEHFLPNGILIMESFVNMVAAPATGLFVALPWKIKGGSGSPLSPILFG